MRPLEPLPPLVSAALEPAAGSLEARIERIALHASGRRRYTVLGDLARGGMGRILRAWDEGLSREVAMKVVAREPPPGSSDEQRADHERRLARFIDEARITGQLDHPGIVPVYEIGVNENGDVFFTMPLVRGENLKSAFARVHDGEPGWTLQRAVAVMHTVCLTVAFAHQKGVVHRDLKPENIMVGPFGEAYVMDWGLALLMGRNEGTGIVGTPAYMSPEQAAGRNAEVGPRSDVYSLGAILYELFARRMPHEFSLETVAHEHDSFEKVLAAPPRPLSEIGSGVPPELAAICAKAMARVPDERYASALEMADDLAAWLEGRSVSVLDQGPWMRLRKWRARNRSLTLALDALAALLLVSGAALFWQDRRRLKEVRAKHAEVRVSAYSAGLSAADLGLRMHEAGEARRRLLACDEELRGWEWRHLELRADASAGVLEGHEGSVQSVAVSPDGSLLASGSDDGTVRLWDGATGAPRGTLREHAGAVLAVAFAPDGTHLASASHDKRVLLWDLKEHRVERVLAVHATDPRALAFSPDGARVVSGDLEGTVLSSLVCDGSTTELGPIGNREGLAGLAFVPGTRLVAAAYTSGFVRLLDAGDLEIRTEAQVSRRALACLEADPAGALLAVASEQSVLLLDASTLEPLKTLTGDGGRIRDVAFAPEGARLATAGFDKVLRVWDLDTSDSVEFEGHEDEVNSVAFFPDGQHLATGAEDDSLRLWDLACAPVRALCERGSWIDAMVLARDGRRLAAGKHDGSLEVLDMASGLELERLQTDGIVECIAWGPDDRLAFGCGQPEVRVARVGHLSEWRTLELREGYPKSLLFSPDGKRLYTRGSTGPLIVHDLATGACVKEIELERDERAPLALTSDGRLLATGTTSGAVILWNASTLERLAQWNVSAGEITSLDFAPDGTRLAVGCWNRSVVLLSIPSGRVERTLRGHERYVTCLAFTPDGKRLVSGSFDHTLRVWRPDEEDALLTLRAHSQEVTAVAFDVTGEVLASASRDGSLRLWRTAGAFGPPRAEPPAK